jgi:conjugative relaxase-like TrwC/TraI family protein
MAGWGLSGVLRLAKLTDAEYVLEQVAGGLEDYYLGAGEAPGVWTCLLAPELGLVGTVTADDLRALIDRTHPGTAEPLGGPKQPTVRAIDATLSAPKSVSLLWAFGTEEIAAVVSIAHVEAVEAALSFVEFHAAVTRRQTRGVRARAATSGWAAATFVHRTSREGDPQLHTHCVIPNLVRRDDGAWVALDATALYRWAKAAGSVYQEELRRRLSDQLGVAWGPDRNGCREMTGLTDGQLRAFSKRTVAIEAHLAATGALPADRKARMQADEAASVATRPRKDRTLTPSRLHDRWWAEADAVDLPIGDALLEAVRGAIPDRYLDRQQVLGLFDQLVDPETGLCAHDSRFAESHVVEAVAAWGAGRLTVDDIEILTRTFLDSNRVIRLVSTDVSGRAPGQWSTVAHRVVEDRVLDHLAYLQQQTAAPLPASGVTAALADAPHLGDDQAGAIRALTGPGPALRALIAPAGHGKTTTLAVAVDAAQKAGRAVLALSTTNQAVDQLQQVGVPAVTVARFALDRRPLQSGSIVIVDEFSQLPTHEADTILGAVADCPGAAVWMVGDPLQTQPVRAGGLAPWLAEQTRLGNVPVAELTENRRQTDPVERQALTAFRHGRITTSQELREHAGWEHHLPDPDCALAAMAAAVLSDIETHGAERVAALAVTHADCEALADRIRADLAEQGAIAGPVLEGPGWAGLRPYQAGDRILLHAHANLADGRRLTNGTFATVLAVTAAGLTVTTDRTRETALVPAGFVTARAADGRPQVSHSWARTIDGVQGGTWAQVHLLASPAVDRYRGYVGQSRSVAPTHTWNTVGDQSDGDHGGRIVTPRSTAAEQIAAALARAQPKTFAAADDPYRTDRAMRTEQARHRSQLNDRPPDVGDRLAEATASVTRQERDLADARDRLAYWQEQHDATAGLRGVTPARRRLHHTAARNVDAMTPIVAHHHERLDDARRLHDDLARQQQAGVAFDHGNHWRTERIEHLRRQLDQHWSAAVVAAARDGHPHAYGQLHLRDACAQLKDQIRNPGDPDAAPAESGAPSTIGDPVRALQDLEQAVKVSAQLPTLRLTTTQAPPRANHPNIHQERIAAMQMQYVTPAPRAVIVEM